MGRFMLLYQLLKQTQEQCEMKDNCQPSLLHALQVIP